MLWVLAALACNLRDAPDNERLVGSGGDTPNDVDGDGYDASVDCDDQNRDVHPGAEETCGNGRDDNCDGTGCQWSGQQTLEGTMLTTTDDESLIGSSLAVCDANGDGVDDVVVGAPGYYHDTGAVYVFYGPIVDDRSSNYATYALVGVDQSRFTGLSVDCRGDIDGDGMPDIVIGEPGKQGGSGYAGDVYVVPGVSSGWPLIADAASSTWTGSHQGDRLGFQVVAIDTNGDDVDEVAVTPALTTIGPLQYGIAYLFEDAGPGAHDADAAAAYVYGEAGNRIEATIGNAGDLDGDGLEELAATGINQVSEELLVFSGPVVGPIANADADVRILGGDPNDVYWSGIGHADLDGDGRDDLYVGNLAHEDYRGAVYAFFGPIEGDTETGTADMRIVGTDDNYPDVGSDVTSPGDVDGDGSADLLIGAMGASVVYLQYGGEHGQYALQKTAQAWWQSKDTQTWAGTTVAAGDVTGDGVVELLVGSPGDGDVDEGSITIVAGVEL
jgi:hypothetical protein